ncbi:MAG TPA: hypothetical protein VM734_35830 [Kofleriaceae bacterium]|nr:hypothetical protein [Kofleriaceae bacterium]
MIRAVALAGALVATVAPAAAEPVEVGPATLALAPAWSGEPAAASPAPADTPLVRRHRDGAVLTVSRAPVGNLDAWRSKTRGAYLDAVEAGFLGPGTVRLGGARPRLGKAEVPVLDLTFRRTAGGTTEVVAVRVLLFRTVTIAAAAAAPDTRAGRRLVEAAVATLAPTK